MCIWIEITYERFERLIGYMNAWTAGSDPEPSVLYHEDMLRLARLEQICALTHWSALCPCSLDANHNIIYRYKRSMSGLVGGIQRRNDTGMQLSQTCQICVLLWTHLVCIS